MKQEINYLKGLGRVKQEIVVYNLPVRGKFPDWLIGSLVRNGPANFEPGQVQYRHFFDGLAMLHCFYFQEGQISYTNRYLKSKAYCDDIANGQINYRGFASDPCEAASGDLKNPFQVSLSDNSPINVKRMANRYLALSETNLPIQFDLPALKTVGVYDFDERPDPTPQTSTAHPHFDFSRKTFYSYSTRLWGLRAYRLYSIDGKSGHRKLLANFPVLEPAYMHSFAITSNYLVLAQFPLILPLIEGENVPPRPFIENFQWQPERGTRFEVFSIRNGRHLFSFEGEACFAYHHVNAFERNGELILDIAAYNDPSIIKLFYLDQLKNPSAMTLPANRLLRYSFSLRGKGGSPEILFDQHLELPGINYLANNGKPYRFVYGVGRGSTYGCFENKLLKIDLEQGQSAEWSEEDTLPGEPVFVPDPANPVEDGGVVLSVVLDCRNDRSFLLVLDAQSFIEIARVEAPQVIPLGLHGAFFPAEA